MPRISDRQNYLEEPKMQIENSHLEMQYLVRNRLHQPYQRTIYIRMVHMYEYVKPKRYGGPRKYQIVDHTTINFLLSHTTDPNFKQQCRMESINFNIIVSKIRDNEVVK
jgi:hypothetical protein